MVEGEARGTCSRPPSSPARPRAVRFGKYAPMRAKDKVVRISVNGEEASFSMHLGAYGQAYFAAETTEIVSGACTPA